MSAPLVLGIVLAWLSVATATILSLWVAFQLGDQQTIGFFWALVMIAVALFGAVQARTVNRVASGSVLAVFSFLGGFSIGGAFAPGALLMLIAAALPTKASEPWIDRVVAIVLVPIAFLPVFAFVKGPEIWLVPVMLVASAAVMLRRRRYRAISWSLASLAVSFTAAFSFSLFG